MSDGDYVERFERSVLRAKLSQMVQSLSSFTDSFHRILLISDFVPDTVIGTRGR